MQKGDYLLTEYVSVTPGEPYRLLPFGRVVKDGKPRDITPELAAMFKLPHFKPPIKRGSHSDDAPAGGHIKALEVRNDGLWAIPEFNDKGAQAVNDGDYRYHSPEVIWSDGPVFEHPDTGEMIHGPLIVGDALLHMPHLGESAALYTVEEPTREVKRMAEKTRWEMIQEWFEAKIETPEPAPEPDPEPVVEVDAFEAVQKERDEYKAKLDQMEAETKQAERIEKYQAAIAETKANDELAEMLAGLEDKTADRIMQEFKALSAQIEDAALLDEKGTSGDGLDEDPAAAFDAAVKAKAEEAKVSYNQAIELVTKETPELAKAYLGG
jgi:phage I-like protein